MQERFVRKIPEVTVWFWVVLTLTATLGEAVAGLLSDTLGLGLTLTTAATMATLSVALIVQFAGHRYSAIRYWVVLILISTVGTLLVDDLVDNLEVPAEAATVGFALALAATFAVWRLRQRTLSLRTVDTPSREGYYWLAVLFALALGKAAGDLTAERLGLGYAPATAIFTGLIAVVAAGHRWLGLDAVFAFWVAFLLTRQLGATLGDLLARPADDGGLGFGTTPTSLVFLAVIAAVIVYLVRTRRDAPPAYLVRPSRLRAEGDR
jgi:uncharacterized membrane-anchored protein